MRCSQLPNRHSIYICTNTSKHFVGNQRLLDVQCPCTLLACIVSSLACLVLDLSHPWPVLSLACLVLGLSCPWPVLSLTCLVFDPSHPWPVFVVSRGPTLSAVCELLVPPFYKCQRCCERVCVCVCYVYAVFPVMFWHILLQYILKFNVSCAIAEDHFCVCTWCTVEFKMATGKSQMVSKANGVKY